MVEAITPAQFRGVTYYCYDKDINAPGLDHFPLDADREVVCTHDTYIDGANHYSRNFNDQVFPQGEDTPIEGFWVRWMNHINSKATTNAVLRTLLDDVHPLPNYCVLNSAKKMNDQDSGKQTKGRTPSTFYAERICVHDQDRHGQAKKVYDRFSELHQRGDLPPHWVGVAFVPNHYVYAIACDDELPVG